MRPGIPDLLVFADARAAGRLAPVVGRLGGNRIAVLLRDPLAPGQALARAARSLRGEVPMLLVSDRVDVALVSGADGVHLPEKGLRPADARSLLGPEALVGVSRHDGDGLAAAFVDGADYATLSPVWDSPGKGPPLGPEGFRTKAASARGPVLALGGVTANRVAEAVRAGAHGIAVVRAVVDASDVGGALAALLQSLDAARESLIDRNR